MPRSDTASRRSHSRPRQESERTSDEREFALCLGTSANAPPRHFRISRRFRGWTCGLLLSFPDCLSANCGVTSAAGAGKSYFGKFRGRSHFVAVDRGGRPRPRDNDTATGGGKGVCPSETESCSFVFNDSTGA